jgi:site-specific recombinase XerC
MLETLYSAALRVSELCGANWQDIDFNKREITVTGKGNKTRVCPLGQKALEALLEYQLRSALGAKAGRPGAGVSLNVGHAYQSADNSADHQKMVQACRREACQPARVQAFSGNSHARERRRYSGNSTAARPCFDHHDRNLYTRGD